MKCRNNLRVQHFMQKKKGKCRMPFVPESGVLLNLSFSYVLVKKLKLHMHPLFDC